MSRTTITLKAKDFQQIKNYCKKEDVKVSALFRKAALSYIEGECYATQKESK